MRTLAVILAFSILAGAAGAQELTPPSTTAPPPATLQLNDLRVLETDGWKLWQKNDGSLWRYRRVRTGSRALWGTGTGLMLLGWLAGGIGSFSEDVDNHAHGLGFWPVIGPWLAAVQTNPRSTATVGLLAFDGVVQAASFAMFLAGFYVGGKRLEKQPLVIAPGVAGNGVGLNLGGRF